MQASRRPPAGHPPGVALLYTPIPLRRWRTGAPYIVGPPLAGGLRRPGWPAGRVAWGVVACDAAGLRRPGWSAPGAWPAPGACGWLACGGPAGWLAGLDGLLLGSLRGNGWGLTVVAGANEAVCPPPAGGQRGRRQGRDRSQSASPHESR